MLKGVFDFVGGAFGLVLVGLFSLGGLYWLWMAVQIGSFGMFVVGIFPLTAVLTAPIGAWSLLFGLPDWIYNIFS
jgi:hypothetical protein